MSYVDIITLGPGDHEVEYLGPRPGAARDIASTRADAAELARQPKVPACIFRDVKSGVEVEDRSGLSASFTVGQRFIARINPHDSFATFTPKP